MTISNKAHAALREVFGYPEFRAQQALIIDHVCAGGDALVLMPTGGGKSLCYQIPALVLPGLCIVVSPLIALMRDQVRALEQLGVRAAYLNSSLPPFEQAEVIARAHDDDFRLQVGILAKCCRQDEPTLAVEPDLEGGSKEKALERARALV